MAPNSIFMLRALRGQYEDYCLLLFPGISLLNQKHFYISFLSAGLLVMLCNCLVVALGPHLSLQLELSAPLEDVHS